MSVVRKGRGLFWSGFGLVVTGLVLFGWMIFSAAGQAGKSVGDLLLVSDLGLLVLVWEYYPVLTVLGYGLAFGGLGCMLAYFRKR